MTYKNKRQADIKNDFFKTNESEYASGDKFLGVYVPVIKKIISPYINNLALSDIINLLKSEFNEIRYGALFALSQLYKKTGNEQYVKLYLKYIKYVNNWNLVDVSAYNIIGKYTFDTQKYMIVKKLMKSNNLWFNRIAIVSMYYFIKRNSLKFPVYVFKQALNNSHHLIQKALGWMIREIGKVNKNEFMLFLTKYCNKMKSITFSYAIEHLSEKEKRAIKYIRLNNR